MERERGRAAGVRPQARAAPPAAAPPAARPRHVAPRGGRSSHRSCRGHHVCRGRRPAGGKHATPSLSVKQCLLSWAWAAPRAGQARRARAHTGARTCCPRILAPTGCRGLPCYALSRAGLGAAARAAAAAGRLVRRWRWRVTRRRACAAGWGWSRPSRPCRASQRWACPWARRRRAGRGPGWSSALRARASLPARQRLRSASWAASSGPHGPPWGSVWGWSMWWREGCEEFGDVTKCQAGTHGAFHAECGGQRHCLSSESRCPLLPAAPQLTALPQAPLGRWPIAMGDARYEQRSAGPGMPEIVHVVTHLWLGLGGRGGQQGLRIPSPR